MAMIDYGAIAFKNGNLISTDMFTPMEETCGFSDYDSPLQGMEKSFDGNYFVIVGNKDILFAFYKTLIVWWCDESVEHQWGGHQWMDGADFRGWKLFEKSIYYKKDGKEYRGRVEIKIKPKNGYYVATFKIDNDDYKVYFGYGVDLDFYKKTHRVNYYRSPEYFLNHIKWWISYRIKDLKRKFRRK